MLSRISRTLITLLLLLFMTQHVMAQTVNEQVDQIVYQDFVKQCIGPSVQNAVDAFYGESRRIAYWQMDILDIKRLEKGSYWFEIIVRVKTSKGSFGPPYGIETVILRP